MAAYSNYLRSQLATHAFRTGSWTKPTTLYVALLTSAPNSSHTGSSMPEVSGGGYSRKAISVADAGWSYSAPTVSNAVAVNWTASADWSAPVTHFAVCDASTNGNVYVYGELTASKTVGSGDSITLPIGELDITLDS